MGPAPYLGCSAKCWAHLCCTILTRASFMHVLWGLRLEYMYCAHEHLHTFGTKHNSGLSNNNKVAALVVTIVRWWACKWGNTRFTALATSMVGSGSHSCLVIILAQYSFAWAVGVCSAELCAPFQPLLHCCYSRAYAFWIIIYTSQRFQFLLYFNIIWIWKDVN